MDGCAQVGTRMTEGAPRLRHTRARSSWVVVLRSVRRSTGRARCPGIRLSTSPFRVH